MWIFFRENLPGSTWGGLSEIQEWGR
jgi:hypothetical protein